ncbi:TonB-dependent receptor [Phenylobacterium aquaticum]|uniref:TonB-dependent receptor n=1 Tax=Phenylobacterium aquaticum TaxID=1763816 RepID=UPI0026ED4B20|nr:TonB-dependent receptor [Phenylobacterium aquaticum]
MTLSNSRRLRAALAVGASAFALSAVSAPAFAAAAATAASAPETTMIEELVVTAEKREQSLQDVPVAISAFTSKTRDLVGINSVQDLTNFTPGFVYSSVNDRASIRGVGRLTNIHAVDGAVAIYIDGLYTTSTVFAGAPPLFIDRVEVLRGPQGTLYGRNSIGGTVNIVSARPTESMTAEVRAIAENYGFTNLQAYVSGPITDNLKFRLSGYKLDQRDGYYTNVNANMPTEGSKRNEYSVELQLEAKLGEHAEAWLKYGVLNWDNRGGPGARSGYLGDAYETGLTDPNFSVVYNPVHGYSTATGAGGIVPGSLQQFNGGTTTTNPAMADSHKINTNTPIHVGLTDVHLLTFNFAYHFPTFDVKYVTGLQNYTYDTTGDLDNSNVKSYQIPLATGSACGSVHTLFSFGVSTVDCSPLTVQGVDTYDYFEKPKWYSHEIDFSSTTDGPLQWIAGLYYYHDTYSATNTLDGYNAAQTQMLTPVLGAAKNPTGAFSISEYSLVTESRAAFGQIDWQATDTLKFTAGLRYTQDKKYGVEDKRVVCFSDVCMPGLYAALGLNGFGPGTAANWGSLLGNLGALPAVGKAFGLGNALAPLGGLGNGAFDLTTALAPTTTAAGAKGVTDPVVCKGTVCTQYTIDPTTGNMVRHLGDKSDAWTGTLGLQWDPMAGTMVYGRYSRGYKAFGLSAGSGLNEPEAASEFVDSIELGLKKNFGRSLQVNAALFNYSYKDLQAPVSVRIGATTVTQFINVPESRSRGLELDAIWQPTQALRFMADYSFNDTEITKSGLYVDVNDNVTPGAVSVKGNKLPQAPRNKFGLNANYSFFLDAGTLTVGGNYVWRDKTYANIFTQTWNEAPTWDQVDLRASWAPTSGKYTLIAYVKNVGDTEGYDAAVAASNRNGNVPNGARNYGLTPPRTYGMELHYKFF